MTNTETDCKKYSIPFHKTGFFSKTMLDYLDQKEIIQPFYNNFPDLEGFKKQIEEKRHSELVSESHRKVLGDALKNQYLSVKTSEETQQNIESLQKENTFTITTGHQLNLFTGPLYFLYKIISTINLAEELTDKFPKQNFVPIYWMATEDHDFDEINYFNFNHKKVQWNRKDGGGVGRFSTEGLQEVFDEFSKHLGNSKNAIYLKGLFSEGYLKHNNLADATKYIANELFGKYGLIIIDADDVSLKKLFIPFVEKELSEQVSFKEVSATNTEFEKHYKVQVNPREINLFYLTNEIRERIVFDDNLYKVKNTAIVWSKSELLNHLNEVPERFSPNVIMRPLYQEVILPNLCYIGGGGEIAYWLQLKAYFEKVNVPFPILLLRNSVQVITEKQFKKLEKLNISLEEIFIKQQDLLKKKVTENSEVSVDFSKQKEFLKNQFSALKEIAKQTDVSFVGAVNAQERKQVKGLENLEKRLLKAEKRKQKELVSNITELQNQLFPNQSLEERQSNFSEYYLEFGNDFIHHLKNKLEPLALEFSIIVL
ncbi:bacillithiol biosynthesis cysteine-adding enzyme BshC [Lutibacter sp. Hel_I_33_5]|uniref:bacillithiol biosynthesis cysteine-adding enzyme BshC n=1 Tax=Lutibacter sp. Hel_I_33_5 TaxID=1566289 RepID=UPI0011A0B9F7|nr:bacillithiol biosynthesis cysteine-adding enzyme BshC [Lutibacter sp. Hel_I_33_5]TVZ55354.1 bacillithiol biosynthesis cysteine-adding enzyme BshC [Lutibacter sp. Hel_I_33_5]